MTITGTTLTVTNETTASQLKQFVDTASVEGRTKLVGKKTAEGIVLYFKSDERSNIVERMFGIAKRRRKAAADAMDQVMARVETKLSDRFQNKDGVRDLFKQVRAFPVAAHGQAMRSGIAQSVFKQVANLETASEIIKPRPPALGAKITRMEAVDPNIPMAALGESRTIPTRNGESLMPSFVLGDKTYEPVRYLAESSFGMVFMYRNVADEGDLLAVKIPVADPRGENAMKLEEEAVTHFKVAGGDNTNPNLLEMKGGLRLTDGTPGIIMDFAPNGTLFDLGRAMSLLKGDGSGQVPKDLAAVITGSMLTGVANGLASMHEDGIAHNDSKDVNVMIGKDGRPLIMDFGESKPIAEVIGSQLSVVNPRYATPELMKVKDEPSYISDYRRLMTEAGTLIDSALGCWGELPVETQGKLKNEFKNLLEQQMLEDVAEMRRLHDAAHFKAIGNDLWSLGTIALMLHDGLQIGDGERDLRTEKRLKTYTTPIGEPDEVARDGGALVKKTDDVLMNDLLFHQFSRAEQDRLEPDVFVRHPAVDRPGVGLDSVFAFVPVLQKMGKFAADIEFSELSIREVRESASRKGRELNEEEKEIIRGHENRIVQLNLEIEELKPEFENLKFRALMDIREKEVERSVREFQDFELK